MKKRLLILLAALCCFCGCSRGVPLLNPAGFYYLRAEYVYGTTDGVICPELRETSGHQGDLDHLLYLYFLGPKNETLVSPFPEGTRLLRAEDADGALLLELTDSLRALSDPQFSLACTCLSLTCMEITDADSVTITSGTRSLTTGRSSILSLDDYKQR